MLRLQVIVIVTYFLRAQFHFQKQQKLLLLTIFIQDLARYIQAVINRIPVQLKI